MKKFLTLVLVSIVGGAITLGSYKIFIEKEADRETTFIPENESAKILPVNNAFTSTISSSGVDFTIAAEKTIDAVVHVKNTSISKGYTSFEDLFFGRPSQRAQIGTGSGVIISPDGLIVTNNHVIDGASELEITTNDNKTYTAEVLGTHPETDIALLKIEVDEELPYITFSDSDNAQVGEWVLAVGNPFNLTSTVTAGIISAKSRDLSGQNIQSFIQTDAAVNRGNSGGALVNTNGELVGINTAITSQTGSYVGYSFAVPSNIAKKIVEDIIEFGNVQQGILGVSGAALNSKAAENFGVNQTEGFYVDSVEPESGAEKAGIQDGDIIKKLDNVEISKFADMKGFLGAKRPNDVVHVTIIRNGDEKIIPVTLVKNESFIIPQLGLVKPASKNDLKTYKTDYGIRLAALPNNRKLRNYLEGIGINEGIIITEIDGQKINSIDDVKMILASKDEMDPITFEFINKNLEKERISFR